MYGCGHEKKHPNYIGIICQHGANTLAQSIPWWSYFGMAWISHLGLLLEAFPHNIRVFSMVCLLPSHHVTWGIQSLGNGSYDVYLTCFKAFWCFVTFCFGRGSCTLRSIYTIGVKYMGNHFGGKAYWVTGVTYELDCSTLKLSLNVCLKYLSS